MLWMHRSFYLSKRLQGKHFIGSKKMSQISPIILTVEAVEGRGKEKGTDTRSRLQWHCPVQLCSASCPSSEELKFSPLLGLQRGGIFWGVHKDQVLWGLSLQDASDKPWSVLPAFHKASGADILEWVYVQECTFPVKLLNEYALADAPSRFTHKTQVIISDRERKKKRRKRRNN